MRLRPPIIGLFLIILSMILHFWVPIKKIIVFPYSLLGIVGIVLGLGIVLWGKETFQRLGTSVRFEKPKKLVMSGPYRSTRNPIYLGYIIILLGISVLLGSIIAFVSPVTFFLIMNFIVIPFEEEWLKRIFGKKYEKYKKQVRRWV